MSRQRDIELMGRKENYSLSCTLLFVKLIAIAISVGLTFFFILYHGGWGQETQSMKKAASTLLSEMELDSNIHLKDSEECDLFKGQWVQNNWGPEYTNNTCKFIDYASDCLRNGRPDKGYLYWSWKPYGCGVVPPLDAKKFMHSMRNKAWAFIGDSILRNQMESLVCILSQVEEPSEIYHDEAHKSRTFYFPAHNITVAAIFVPLLVKYSTSPNKELQVYLDTLDDRWTTEYHKYSYVVIANGQWYTKSMVIWDQGKIIGCHNCQEKIEELGIAYPYIASLRLTFNFITSNEHKPVVFFRTWQPDHFEHGKWYSGGICNRTQPYRDGEYTGLLFDQLVRDIEVDEFNKVAHKGAHMELLDTFHLSLLRPDGHPGRYRNYYPPEGAKVQNDCLHSCLPGPVDTWNDLVMEILMRTGIVSSTENEGRSAV